MRCHLCCEHAHIATSVVLLSEGSDRPFVMRLCDDHTTDFEERRDAVIVDVPPIVADLAAA